LANQLKNCRHAADHSGFEFQAPARLNNQPASDRSGPTGATAEPNQSGEAALSRLRSTLPEALHHVLSTLSADQLLILEVHSIGDASLQLNILYQALSVLSPHAVRLALLQLLDEIAEANDFQACHGVQRLQSAATDRVETANSNGSAIGTSNPLDFDELTDLIRQASPRPSHQAALETRRFQLVFVGPLIRHPKRTTTRRHCTAGWCMTPTSWSWN